jgi:hypothetical protein
MVAEKQEKRNQERLENGVKTGASEEVLTA